MITKYTDQYILNRCFDEANNRLRTTGSGGGGIVSSDIEKENQSANCNGTNLVFTLSFTPITKSVQVFLNGLLQEDGVGKDYILLGATITFTIAPTAGDILIIHYTKSN